MKSFGKLFNTILSSAAIALPSLFTVHFAFGDGGPLDNISILDSTSFQNPIAPEEPGNISPTASPEPVTPTEPAGTGGGGETTTDQSSTPQQESVQESDDDDTSDSEDKEDEDEEDEEDEDEEEPTTYTESKRKVVWGNFPSALKNAAGSLFEFMGTIVKRKLR